MTNKSALTEADTFLCFFFHYCNFTEYTGVGFISWQVCPYIKLNLGLIYIISMLRHPWQPMSSIDLNVRMMRTSLTLVRLNDICWQEWRSIWTLIFRINLLSLSIFHSVYIVKQMSAMIILKFYVNVGIADRSMYMKLYSFANISHPLIFNCITVVELYWMFSNSSFECTMIYLNPLVHTLIFHFIVHFCNLHAYTHSDLLLDNMNFTLSSIILCYWWRVVLLPAKTF